MLRRRRPAARRLGGRRHTQTRGVLRILGPTILVIGIVLAITGFVSFFQSMGTHGPPKYFWCTFLGLPLLAIGAGMTKIAFLGAIYRYAASETVPVANDAIGDLADGTEGSVRKIARAVGDGLRDERRQDTDGDVKCKSCGEGNDADARFCSGCGQSLKRTCSKMRNRQRPRRTVLRRLWDELARR